MTREGLAAAEGRAQKALTNAEPLPGNIFWQINDLATDIIALAARVRELELFIEEERP